VILEGKRLLVTGVITKNSIAWEVARQAQESGAEVVLTGFGRAKRMSARRRSCRKRSTCSSST
jgi:enoyl-[acyl-carrier protein] reductase I